MAQILLMSLMLISMRYKELRAAAEESLPAGLVDEIVGRANVCLSRSFLH